MPQSVSLNEADLLRKSSPLYLKGEIDFQRYQAMPDWEVSKRGEFGLLGCPIAVTGGSGFIGKILCEGLVRRGFRVRALVRDRDRAHGLAAQGIELVAGDMANSDALDGLVHGAAAVIHIAGAVRGASQAEFDRSNVDGTVALLKALARQAAPPRLLFLSTLAASQPELSWYAGSKRRAEVSVIQSNLDWVILRPPVVYGPGDAEISRALRLIATHGILPVPGAADARFSLIHVEDLADGIIACLPREDTKGRVFTLSDGKPGGYSWHDLATVAAEVICRPVKLWTIPQGPLDEIAAINLAVAGTTGRSPMLTPAKLRELRHPDWVASNDAISAATTWRPRICLRDGLTALLDALPWPPSNAPSPIPSDP